MVKESNICPFVESCVSAREKKCPMSGSTHVVLRVQRDERDRDSVKMLAHVTLFRANVITINADASAPNALCVSIRVATVTRRYIGVSESLQVHLYHEWSVVPPNYFNVLNASSLSPALALCEVSHHLAT